RSRIVNSYWSVVPDNDDRIGYTPLLFAMGARMLALTIPRFGVIGEGPSDAILPSLLRGAVPTSRLPYRVVPGLAELADQSRRGILATMAAPAAATPSESPAAASTPTPTSPTIKLGMRGRE
ncbi:MAG: hypothetical protein LC808_10630, partial [Actinobacteria bacterium]|nr:hypothetical protein [Actinomycetota bacterium]